MKNGFKYTFLLLPSFRGYRKLIVLNFLFFWGYTSLSQNIDSLKILLKNATVDTTKLRLYVEITDYCEYNEIMKYSESAIELCDKLLKQDMSALRLKNRLLQLKGRAFGNIGYFYSTQSDFDKAIGSNKISLKIMEEIGDKKGMAVALNSIGNNYLNKGEIDKALDYLTRCLKCRIEVGESHGIAEVLNNLGALYSNNGEYEKALEHYKKSLKIKEKINDQKGIAETVSNMGVIYSYRGGITKALECYERAMKINESVNEKSGVAANVNNIAAIYQGQGDFIKALQYYERALKLYVSLGNKQGVAYVNLSIGAVYDKKRDYSRALINYALSLKMQEEIGDLSGLSYSCLNMALAYGNLNDLANALKYGNKSLISSRNSNNKKVIAYSYNALGATYLKLAAGNIMNKQKFTRLSLLYSDSSLSVSKELGLPDNLSRAEKLISEIYTSQKKFVDALKHYRLFILYRDSTNNEITRKATVKNQLKYEFDKKEAVLLERQIKEDALAEEKHRDQQIVICLVIFGLLIVAVFSAVVFRSLKTTNRQKDIIEAKQKEILDSIHYAKRIQTALITNEKYINNALNRLINS